MIRLLWCLGAGWVAVALLRYAMTPRTPVRDTKPAARTHSVPGIGRRARSARLTHRAARRRTFRGVVRASGFCRTPDPRATPGKRVVHRSLRLSTDRSALLGTHPGRSTVGRMTDAAEPLAELLLRRDAVATGWSDDELGRLVRAGELTRLRRGAYVDRSLPTTAPPCIACWSRATLAGSAPARRREPSVGRGPARAAAVGRPPRPRARHPQAPRLRTTRAPSCTATSPGSGTTRWWRSMGWQVTTRCGPRSTWRGHCRTRQPSSRSTSRCTRDLLSHELLRGRLFDIAGTPGSRQRRPRDRASPTAGARASGSPAAG